MSASNGGVENAISSPPPQRGITKFIRATAANPQPCQLQFHINEFGAFMIVPFLVDERKGLQNKHSLAKKL